MKEDTASRSKLTETQELDEEWALFDNGDQLRLWN